MKNIQIPIILFSIFAYSQPPKNYYDYNSQYSQDRRDGQKSLEKQMDGNRQPNSRSSGCSNSAPFVWLGEVPYLLKTKAERAAIDAATRQRNQVAAIEANERRAAANKIRENKKLVYDYHRSDSYLYSAYAQLYEMKKRQEDAAIINLDDFVFQIRNSTPNSTGIHLIKDGNLFEGTLKDGEPDGKGKAYYFTKSYDVDAGDFYEGEFDEGMRHGIGKLTKKDGSYAEGKFKKFSLDRVKYYDKFKKEITLGEFRKKR